MTPIMRIARALIALICIILTCSYLNAQNKIVSKPHSYTIERIDLNHQTPYGKRYEDIEVDTMGYIWIAGSEGLHVYDGVKTITYFGSDPRYRIIPEDWETRIFDIVRRSDGLFWLLLLEENAQILFNPYTRSVSTINKVEKDKTIVDHIQVNSKDELIFFTRDQHSNYELKRLGKDNTVEVLYRLANNDNPGSQIHQLSAINSKLYFYTKYEFFALNEQGKVLYREPLYGSSGIKRTGDGLFGVFKNNTIKKFDPDKYIWVTYTKSPTPETPINYFASHDSLIVCKSGQNILVKDLRKNTHTDLSENFKALELRYNHNGRVTNFIETITVASDYYMLGQNALYHIEKIPIDIDSLLVPLPSENKKPSVRQLSKLANGNIAVAHIGGLAVQNDNSKEFEAVNVSDKDQKYLNKAYSLHQWNGQFLWNNGAINQDGSLHGIKEIDFGLTAAELVDSVLYSYLWFSREYKFRKKNLVTGSETYYKLKDPKNHISSINLDMISTIQKDPNKPLLWLGTSGAGIIATDLDINIVKQYSRAENKCLNAEIFDLLIKGNELYFATRSGIGCIDLITDSISMYEYTEVHNSNLLEPLIVWSILDRDSSSVYVGSQNGLYKFDIHKKSFTGLKPTHPLSKLEFNRNSKLIDDDTIYMGTTTGLYVFTENDLLWDDINENHPPIVIENIIINRGGSNEFRPTIEKQEDLIRLNPSDNRLEVNFSVLNLDKSYFYAYRIPEQDTTWSPFSLDGNVNIVSLPAGKNTLELIACNHKDYGHASRKTIHFHKSQFWYYRWWAYIIYVLAIGLAYYLIYRYRLKQIHLYQELRTKISSDLHDDVGSIMSGISLQSEVMSYTSNDEQKPMLLELSRLSKEAMERMRDIIWALDSRNDTFDDLLIKMKEYAEYNLSRKNISVKFYSDASKSVQALNPEKRQNIYYIYKEAISNIIKHSNASLVKIKMTRDSNNFILEIADNGIQDRIKISAGQGIANMKMRAKRIGGQISISENNGYKVILKL